MTEPDPSANPDPDDAIVDDDEAAIDEALAALTAGVPLTATLEDEDEDEEVIDDEVGDADENGALPDDDAADAVIDDMEGGLSPIHFEEPGQDEDAALLELSEPMPAVSFATDDSDRIDRLEALARALVSAETARDQGRVRRKVSASATGAAAAGAVPLILQLTGALNLSAEESATVTAAAAALASFITGYLTPERKPALQAGVVHEALKTQ